MRTRSPRFVARTILSVAFLFGLAAAHAHAAIVDPLANGPAVIDSTDAKPENPFTISDLTDDNQTAAPQSTVQIADPPTNNQPPSGNAATQPQPALTPAAPPAAFPGPVPPANSGAARGSAPESLPDPCSFAPNKPFNQLGININPPDGKLPSDLAGACWQQINTQSDPCSDRRCWPILLYQWDANALCYHPLYFEETNLERYGYGCGCCCCCGLGNCVQPFVSGAHFFGTLPILPYCIAHECPGDCVYTLGHYRPGSCPPWQCYRPPIDLVAGAAEAGFWIGMAAAFP
jgi:hypothetical protein